MMKRINISRARSFSRRKRAKKAMSILREKLEGIEGEKVSVSPEVNNRIWKNGVENPPTSIDIEIVETASGKRAVLADAAHEVEEPEPEEVEEEHGSEEEDYEEIVSGTVGDAKDAIRELEDPDYEALLEAEKQGKDRKTLKEFIENRI